jgi:hypothetical protein
LAAWLPVLLRVGSPETAAFQEDCLRSAEAPLQLARLRRASPRLGGSLLSVAGYLRGLAAASGAALGAVLRWAGLDLERPADERFGHAWGRLAHAVGLGEREALLRLRLTFADEVGQDIWPVLARTRGGGGGPSDVLAECESFLEEAARHWEEGARARLGGAESALRESYRRVGATEAAV